MTRIVNPKVEYRTRPLAVGEPRPRFSWQLESEDRGVRQASSRLTVEHGGVTLWDSGTVAGDRTVGIEYGGDPLPAGAVIEWRVEVVLEDGTAPEPVTDRFETAPDSADWGGAGWITLRRTNYQHDDHRQLPVLRRTVPLRGAVARARWHVTAGGLFQPWADGERLSPANLAPGWTDYRFRVPFHTYDVTARCAEGSLTLGAVLADGWYCGNVGPYHLRNFWGRYPVLKAILVLDYVDGSREIVPTDEQWEASFGPILTSDLLQGEVYDARIDLGDWSNGDGEGWRTAQVQQGPEGRLVPALIDAAGPVDELRPVSITEPTPGSYVVDFGQNFAGHVRLTADGPAGTIVRIRHAEVLNPDGTIYTENLRGARATDTLILSGDGPDEFEPSFTYHGFRYAEITGLPGGPDPASITGIPVSSIPSMTGRFETDSAMVNQLQHNIQWSMFSNFIEVPTDCPSRDERLGWTGDAQIFAPTATFNADLAAFYTKWMDDIDDTKMENGALPDVAPCVVMEWAQEGSSGYAEAGLIVPWTMYLAYGDTRILERHFAAGAAWVDYILERSPDLVWRERRNTDYGDWLAPVETPKDLTSTAYFARSAQLLAKFAEVLGRPDEQGRYTRLAADIAAAFRADFVAPDGTMPAGTQTAYTLALRFDLLLDEQRPVAAAALADDVERRGHITTGFLAVAQLLPLLTEIGRSDLAYRLLLNDEYPSWGHPIKHGATTVWERWDGWRPETGFQDPLMNSFNHFALGSVGEWMYASIAGLAPAEPGYARVAVEPRIGHGVDSAWASTETVHGTVSTSWRVRGDRFELELDIPANVRATVRVPGTDVHELDQPIVGVAGVSEVREDEGEHVIDLGSGRYRLTARLG